MMIWFASTICTKTKNVLFFFVQLSCQLKPVAPHLRKKKIIRGGADPRRMERNKQRKITIEDATFHLSPLGKDERFLTQTGLKSTRPNPGSKQAKLQASEHGFSATEGEIEIYTEYDKLKSLYKKYGRIRRRF